MTHINVHHAAAARRSRGALLAIASLFAVVSCEENLPNGPDRFAAQLRIVVPRDTIVVGDSTAAQAQALDANGHLISGLTFKWTSSNNNVVGLGVPPTTDADAIAGRTNSLISVRPGQAMVTLSLPDSRFTATDAARQQTVVIAGLRVLSTHDSTLTAVNDTAFAIATSVTHVNGAPVDRKSQGIHWIHRGTHTQVVGDGDTIRYIARSNGADTLIATHDFCLRGARCADTVVARVSQQLSMSLSEHILLSWSFADSLAPTVTIADRRGVGLAGTSVRFIPLTVDDSAVVKVSATIGASNPSTGVVASPRLVSIKNGGARVAVIGLAPDGLTVLGRDTIADTVRQVARRVQVEPLSAVVSLIDSIPFRALARDAHGALIADATITVAASGTTLHNGFAGPLPANSATGLATITPTLTGIALPANQPRAPQIAPLIDPSQISLFKVDTAVAGTATRQLSVTVFDSLARLAVGTTVSFTAQTGAIPAAVQSDGNGIATVIWTPSTVAGSYTLTGFRTPSGGITTPSDSVGRIVIRRSLVVIAAIPSAAKTTVAVGATSIAVNGTTTVTITVRDAFNNIVLTATPADFSVPVATRGAIGAVTCANGVCTATYTAPATAGADAITVKIGGVNVLNSPLALTIN
ncbi:MAG TPA: Ig-like domain-containing protein [Gemmatimonadaceae bacterium]|jgi:hypothetical protein|nr:Ig-like domain-containing protein [Gemmatimonadaceae bacterium]